MKVWEFLVQLIHHICGYEVTSALRWDKMLIIYKFTPYINKWSSTRKNFTTDHEHCSVAFSYYCSYTSITVLISRSSWLSLFRYSNYNFLFPLCSFVSVPELLLSSSLLVVFVSPCSCIPIITIIIRGACLSLFLHNRYHYHHSWCLVVSVPAFLLSLSLPVVVF